LVECGALVVEAGGGGAGQRVAPARAGGSGNDVAADGGWGLVAADVASPGLDHMALAVEVVVAVG